jgi:cobaltochelatase CobN
MAPPRVLRSAVRRIHRTSGLAGQVRLSISDCLGPCSEANVVFVYMNGRALWFRRMNSAELVAEVFRYVGDASADPTRPLPPRLARHSFTWAGGGVGPEPPVADEDAQQGEGAA